MVAIITDKIKKQLAQGVLDEFAGATPGDSDNYYYVGVGRSQIWDPTAKTDVAPSPTATDRDERVFRYSMQSVKAVEGMSFVVPLYDWAANTIYSQYSDAIEGHPTQSYYVRTSDSRVYLCVRTGKNATGVNQVSTVEPNHTQNDPTIQADGYVWKFMYTIFVTGANKFLTSNFMPVKFVDSASTISLDFQQYSVQNNAVPGQIVGYRVADGGGAYSSEPTITIVGNGTNAKGRAVLSSSGAIAAVEVGDSAAASLLNNMGSGYSYASVTVGTSTLVAGGTAASVVPVIGPQKGLGGDPTDDLRTTAVMLNIKPDGKVNNTWVVDNDYRQIGILKNPKQYTNTSAAFTATQGLALNKMTLTSLPGIGNISFAGDIEMTGDSTSAKGWLDYFDDSNTLWYHQDDYTGFKPFADNETITIQGYNATTLTADSALSAPDIDRHSGELLYIDNRATATTRDAAQTEDIKVVIKL